MGNEDQITLLLKPRLGLVLRQLVSTYGNPSEGIGVLHLGLGTLQVAGDAGVFGPVQHGADFLAQFQRCRPDEPRRLSPNPDEDVRPAVQDVDTLGVQEGLQLWRRTGTCGFKATQRGYDAATILEEQMDSPVSAPGGYPV